ncbi:SRPBCC family protein [Microbacterium barkeri]|uniref:SRPBCC family protein n=1 Tax=Microbacterium barkeri TaxID=33917 RepID=UPI0024AEAA7E|nr:SRPBCC family protein [Microbacterium barkeri]MDI6943612.1 SRPBCC family protein [Microbacterium barkeri]
MSINIREIRCTPEEIFRVLGDGWLYPVWVVGASRMREVDDGWPRPGAELHHSVGSWPLLLDDTTECVEWDPPRRMVLQARGWPIGEARVTIEVKARGAGSLVRISEAAVEGPGSLVPRFLVDPPLHARNAETLRRLAFLAEGHADRDRAAGS